MSTTQTLQLEIIAHLNRIYAELDALVVQAAITGDDQSATGLDLRHARDQIKAAIERLLQSGTRDTLAALTQASTQLDTYRRELAQAGQTIERIKRGIDIAGKVLDVASSVAAAVL